MTADDLDRPILITGGCGFIGCNLADALASRGTRIVALDNLSRAGVRENAQWLKSRHGDLVSIVTGDIRDAISVIEAVRGARAVLHLAAQVAVTGSLQDPADDFEINARGTLNVLEAIRIHNHSAPMIFASTNKVYGRLVQDTDIKQIGRRHVPADLRLAAGVGEDAPLDFYSPYGCSKGAADQYVRDYARVYGMNTAVLRMSCIYGPRQFGTEDQGWLAHFMLRSILGEPLTIYGDGLQVRDALHVSDAAAAWIAVLENIATVRGRVFNLGGGPENAISLLELIDQIALMRGAAPSLNFDGWRPGDQPWYVSRFEALSSAVGWRPQVPLREGLQSLLEWLEGRFGPAGANSPRELRV
jgi:CDP-paratose 2-epimerase